MHGLFGIDLLQERNIAKYLSEVPAPNPNEPRKKKLTTFH